MIIGKVLLKNSNSYVSITGIGPVTVSNENKCYYPKIHDLYIDLVDANENRRLEENGENYLIKNGYRPGNEMYNYFEKNQNNSYIVIPKNEVIDNKFYIIKNGNPPKDLILMSKKDEICKISYDVDDKCFKKLND